MSRLRTVSKVLQIKDQRKEELELEVKKIRNLIKQEQTRLDSLEKTFVDTIAMFEEKHKGTSINVHEMGLFCDYFSQLYKKMDMQKIAITRRLAELNDKQNALVEAYKEKKLFEILKGKIVQEDIRERAVSEQKEMDFIFLSRGRRNK